jgi:Uncharacterized protein conserved in bacteria C-term(DUF2220)
VNPEPILAAAILNAVEAHPTRRVPLHTLMKAAAAVDHTAAVSVGWRSRIYAAITDLAADNHIALPKTKWDHRGIPALPQYVTRPAPPKSRPDVSRAPVWHAELAWAAELADKQRLSTADRQFLAAINGWLPSRRGVYVPLRERSLEIFGDEKLLETRVTGPLFGPARLTLDLLQTYQCWPNVERTGAGPGDWLIVENYTTYHSLGCRAAELGFDGQIVWGSGNGVTTRLAALAAEPARPPRLYYFGDIDAGGLRIARSAAARAEHLHLPKLTAAQGLYAFTASHGTRRADHNPRRPDPAVLAWAREWLGKPLGAAVTDVVAAGERIVQETVGTELLHTTSLTDWF